MSYTHRRIQSVSLLIIVAFALLLLLDVIYYGDQQSMALRLKDQILTLFSQIFPAVTLLLTP